MARRTNTESETMISKPSNPLDSFRKEEAYVQLRKDELARKIHKRIRANELSVLYKREYPIEFFKLYKLNEKDVLYGFTHGNTHGYILFVVKNDDLFDIVELDREIFTKKVFSIYIYS